MNYWAEVFCELAIFRYLDGVDFDILPDHDDGMSDCGCNETEGCPTTGDAPGCEDPDYARGFRTKRSLIRGDTLIVDFDLVDPLTSTPVDTSAVGVEVWFTLAETLPRLATSPVLAQATLTNGGITNRDVPSSGHIRAMVAASITANAIADSTARLYYDVQVKTADGRVFTFERGIYLVDPDVTRAV
jgi:hypothetical protein